MVSQNTTHGTILTDEGSWSDNASEDLDKDHLLCAKHKSNLIMKYNDAPGKFNDHFMDDMSDLIFENISEQNLAADFVSLCLKYAKCPRAKQFIQKLSEQKERVQSVKAL